MKKVNFKTIKAGDLVQVPRTQFAPLRHGWNGWLFSEAVVLEKRVSKKNGRPILKVEMQTPGKVSLGKNSYTTMEKSFYADCVFYTTAIERAERFLSEDGVSTPEECAAYLDGEVVGADWIRFIFDKGFLFKEVAK